MIIKKDISNEWQTAAEKVGNTPRPGEPKYRRAQSIDMIVVHETQDDDKVGEDVWSIIKYHTAPNPVCSTGCWTICYHYYVERLKQDTVVWKTVPEEIITFHSGMWNDRSIGVVVDKTDKDIVTGEKYTALVNLLADLCISHNLNPRMAIVGHRNLYWSGWREPEKGKIVLNKTCPGAISIVQLRLDVADILGERGFMCPPVADLARIYKGEEYYTVEIYDILSKKFNRLHETEGMIKSTLEKVKKWMTKSK